VYQKDATGPKGKAPGQGVKEGEPPPSEAKTLLTFGRSMEAAHWIFVNPKT